MDVAYSVETVIDIDNVSDFSGLIPEAGRREPEGSDEIDQLLIKGLD